VGNRIKKGDTVEVISGNDRGLRGTVQWVYPKADRLIVSGINFVKKHQRRVRAGRTEVQPGIIEFEVPIHLSNVMLVCPQCNDRTRVGFTRLEDGRKVRVCRECGEAID
jgi:large subunit ribosomal protein L24